MIFVPSTANFLQYLQSNALNKKKLGAEFQRYHMHKRHPQLKPVLHTLLYTRSTSTLPRASLTPRFWALELHRPTPPKANHINTPLTTNNTIATTNMATTFSTECLTSSVRPTTSPVSSSISTITERRESFLRQPFCCPASCSLVGMYCINVSLLERVCRIATAYGGGASRGYGFGAMRRCARGMLSSSASGVGRGVRGGEMSV